VSFSLINVIVLIVATVLQKAIAATTTTTSTDVDFTSYFLKNCCFKEAAASSGVNF
jgi:hypothetical protein